MPASSHSKLQRCQLLCFFNIGVNFSVKNGSLYHETCNVSSLKCNRNSAETISRCCMTQILMFSGKSILFIFRRFSYKGNKVVDPTLICGCRTPIRAVSPTSLSLTSLTVTSRPCKKQVHAVRDVAAAPQLGGGPSWSEIAFWLRDYFQFSRLVYNRFKL